MFSKYGFVFGVVSLASFIFSPIFAHYGPVIGPKLVYNIGSFSQGIDTILFGFLEFANNTNWFIWVSYLLR